MKRPPFSNGHLLVFLAFVLHFLLNLQNVNAQTEIPVSDAVKQYFEDRKNPTTQNMFSVKPTLLINGELPVFYERNIANSLGLEIGAGLLLPYYLPGVYELVGAFGSNNEIGDRSDELKVGTTYWLSAKHYLAGEAPDGIYYGFSYRRRNYNLLDARILVSEITVNFGWNQVLNNQIVVGYMTGIGSRWQKSKSKSTSVKEDLDGSGVAIHLNLSVGWLF